MTMIKIAHLGFMHLDTVASLSRQSASTSVSTAKLQPNKSIAGIRIEKDHLVCAVCSDVQQPGPRQVLFGRFVEYKNFIVTIRLKTGKLRYLFNSERYKWIVNPVRHTPRFSLPPKSITCSLPLLNFIRAYEPAQETESSAGSRV